MSTLSLARCWPLQGRPTEDCSRELVETVKQLPSFLSFAIPVFCTRGIGTLASFQRLGSKFQNAFPVPRFGHGPLGCHKLSRFSLDEGRTGVGILAPRFALDPTPWPPMATRQCLGTNQNHVLGGPFIVHPSHFSDLASPTATNSHVPQVTISRYASNSRGQRSLYVLQAARSSRVAGLYITH